MHKPIQYSRVPFPQFTDRHVVAQTDNMAQLERVKVEIAVELGKARFVLEDLLKLKPATDDVDLNDPEMTATERSQYVVKLDTQIGEPVDVLINDRVFAQGEVVSTSTGQSYGVRVISILNEEQQIAAQAKR
ncbi:TPA: hypothetical protein EYN98_32000 [Candidatus Poribacteria bacterium]|jgi:flagellar motor switch protein FliN/FliY|nr:hypothetical protein [Candidatus Poribacteria bacterium]HIA70588.1 hypothetical protein [Candidatus Poribacteria bacterium]HIB90375.1 hypothetical protein [Candidatus Poribacteria bacterium]HIC03892.1 hypothetical protein [Candidatus Poribacteria bacterium]HIN30361.1 hypothetical protein [Candidatus Poribacteria bacterium]